MDSSPLIRGGKNELVWETYFWVNRLFLGGPLGAIAGAALGHHLIDKKENGTFRTTQPENIQTGGHTEQTQAAYFISIFSILGKLAKIDGVVAQDEISVVEQLINSMSISDTEKRFAKQVFNESKNSSYHIEDFAMQFYQYANQQPALLVSFFDVLFQVAAADGKLHHAEEDALKKIKQIFQISDQQYENLKAIYFNDLDAYFKILNSSSTSSNEEIKSNYKKLVKDFHPDTIVSKGLPEEFTVFATKRFQEIQGAYEKIRKERHF